MVLSNLSLINFRTHKSTNLNFSEALNYIVGGNGQGKTSVLEAAYFLCTTKSFFSKDFEALSFHEKSFELEGTFKSLIEDKVRIVFSADENRKHYYKNEKLITRGSQIIGLFPVVILTPSDHEITQGSPADRRKFIDSVICQASSTYLNILLDYNRSLKHRAVVLSRLRDNYSKQSAKELEAWTEKIIDTGVQIIRHRKNFIEVFNNYILESYKRIIDDKEIPQIEYKTLETIDKLDNINTYFKELINKKEEEEIRRTTNLVGPHKDEFIFSINSVNLKTYGSQGQHKTFQTALRFAEFFYLKDATGKTPIFLLDDVFGELDAYRAGKISKYLKEVGQAFITLTDFADFSFLTKEKNDLIIKLENGNVTYA